MQFRLNLMLANLQRQAAALKGVKGVAFERGRLSQTRKDLVEEAKEHGIFGRRSSKYPDRLKCPRREVTPINLGNAKRYRPPEAALPPLKAAFQI